MAFKAKTPTSGKLAGASKLKTLWRYFIGFIHDPVMVFLLLLLLLSISANAWGTTGDVRLSNFGHCQPAQKCADLEAQNCAARFTKHRAEFSAAKSARLNFELTTPSPTFSGQYSPEKQGQCHLAQKGAQCYPSPRATIQSWILCPSQTVAQNISGYTSRGTISAPPAANDRVSILVQGQRAPVLQNTSFVAVSAPTGKRGFGLSESMAGSGTFTARPHGYGQGAALRERAGYGYGRAFERLAHQMRFKTQTVASCLT